MIKEAVAIITPRHDLQNMYRAENRTEICRTNDSCQIEIINKRKKT